MAGTNPEMDNALIQQMSQQQLGGAAPQAAAPQPQQDPTKVDSPPSTAEKAQAAVSPSTEGDKSREESFIEVQFADGRKEVMSASQVAGMATRYKDLNHKNATKYKPLEPAIDFLETMVSNARAAGKEVSGDDVTQFVQAAIKAYTSNPRMGNQQDPTPDRPDGKSGQVANQIDEEIRRWEQENAVSLPPMYRQGMQLIGQLQAENAQMRQMMGGIIQQAQGVNQQASQMAQSSSQQAADAFRVQAANNLNSAQQALQLPDEAEQDFFDFAFGRGYTLEDFVDRDLTIKVMQDFAANRATPEMERLRSLNQRRQAFTGAATSSPGMGGAAGVQSNADQDFMQAVAAKAMQKRGMA